MEEIWKLLNLEMKLDSMSFSLYYELDYKLLSDQSKYTQAIHSLQVLKVKLEDDLDGVAESFREEEIRAKLDATTLQLAKHLMIIDDEEGALEVLDALLITQDRKTVRNLRKILTLGMLLTNYRRSRQHHRFDQTMERISNLILGFSVNYDELELPNLIAFLEDYSENFRYLHKQRLELVKAFTNIYQKAIGSKKISTTNVMRFQFIFSKVFYYLDEFSFFRKYFTMADSNPNDYDMMDEHFLTPKLMNELNALEWEAFLSKIDEGEDDKANEKYKNIFLTFEEILKISKEQCENEKNNNLSIRGGKEAHYKRLEYFTTYLKRMKGRAGILLGKYKMAFKCYKHAYFIAKNKLRVDDISIDCSIFIILLKAIIKQELKDFKDIDQNELFASILYKDEEVEKSKPLSVNFFL